MEGVCRVGDGFLRDRFGFVSDWVHFIIYHGAADRRIIRVLMWSRLMCRMNPMSWKMG